MKRWVSESVIPDTHSDHDDAKPMGPLMAKRVHVHELSYLAFSHKSIVHNHRMLSITAYNSNMRL